VNVATGLPSTVSAGSISSISAGSSAQDLTFTATQAGSLAGTVNLDLVSNPLPGTGLTGRTTQGQIELLGAAYRYAEGTLDTTAINYGYVHAGAYGGSLSTGVSITNTAVADGYSDALGLGLSGTIAGISYSSSGTDLAGGASTQVGSVVLDTTTPRVISSSLSGTLQSVPTVGGLTGMNVGSGTINVSAVVYSGLSTWTSSTGGNWNNFGNWDVTGGAPGTDAGFTTTDTATFGSAIGSTPATINVNTAVSVKSVTFDNADAGYTVAGPNTLTFAGSPQLSSLAGSHVISAPVVIANNLSTSVAAGSSLTVSGGISGGSHGITKTGEGTLRLAGSSSYGPTTVQGGTLNVAGSITGGVTLASGTNLLGTGAIGGALEVSSGATVSSGELNQAGSISIGEGESTWSGGGTYSWNLLSTSGFGDQNALIGTGFDHIGIAGSLKINATPDDPFVIDIASLSAQGQTGSLVGGWDASQPYSWTILTAAGGITGASPASFRVNADTFLAANAGGQNVGWFSVVPSSDGLSLNLVYAVPEPTVLFGAAALAGYLMFSRPRQRRAA
jgi:autotransporter-associated beta strand protein